MFRDNSDRMHDEYNGYSGLLELQESELQDPEGDWELAHCLELAWGEVIDSGRKYW